MNTAIETDLIHAAEEALENMCFTSVLESHVPPAETAGTTATVTFSGDAHGWLRLTLSPEAASCVSANFLASEPEEVAAEQRDAIVSELANVVCGSLLSRVKPEGCFRLSSPTIGTVTMPEGAVCDVGLELDSGLARLQLALIEADKP